MSKRKKVSVIREYNIYNGSLIKINKEKSGEYFFEIKTEVTSDIAEAVSIMMTLKNDKDPIWDLQIPKIDIHEIKPERCLFWLSGGNDEWYENQNYKKTWYECYLNFQQNFGLIVISIIEEAKTLKDIRDGFKKYLNLPILYNFAIESEII